MQQNMVCKEVFYTLPDIINIEVIESLADDIKRIIPSEKISLILDVSKVEQITTAGVQLIMSLEKTLSALGGEFWIKKANAVFSVVFKEMGLENFLSRRIRND